MTLRSQARIRPFQPYQLLLVTTLFSMLASSTVWKGQDNYTSISDAFVELTNLTLQPGSHRDPLKGGQNLTHCCLLAVNASLEVVNGTIVKNTPSYINTTIDDFLAATRAGQFPCGAAWDSSPAGAPIVEVPYSWLEKTCPGWQLSTSGKGNEGQWISPFVGFLLPAVVFCLTIPRRRKLAVWRRLFVPDMSLVFSWLLAPFAMILAGLCVVCDTILWLSTCFAFASPMLLSGFYEAYLDYTIINFLQEKTENFRLTLDMRARLLFVILCGNLDLEPEIRESDRQFMQWNTDQQDYNEHWPNFTGTIEHNPSSPWTHIETLVHPIRTYRDTDIETPRQWPLHDEKCLLPNCTDPKCKEVPIPRTLRVQRDIGRTKTRLRTMLACQYSFGATVGCPIVFFLGTFVFTIVTVLSNLGDNDTSLALAFGMWYMIIPHLSIVSGLLLAGNNPNTLEGVVAHEFGDIEDPESFEEKRFGTKLFELAYSSRYKPQWLWLRGRSKRDWIEMVWRTYGFRPPAGHKGDFVPDEDMVALRKVTTLSFRSWSVVVGLTILLMGVPFVLAFLTGFYTPQVGVSCRSLTFTVYAISQICQIVLWLWAFPGAPQEGKYLGFLRKQGILDRKGFFTPTEVTTLWSRKSFFSLRTAWAVIWYSLATLFGLGGVFTSIGGTTMQLMGVYRSGKCDISAGWWTKPNGNVGVIISTNYALEIEDANKYWKSCGVTATVFLGAVCFCGWWYQRRLRGLFRQLVNDIGDPETDREDVKAAMVLSSARKKSVPSS